jgi:hypothetical protein
VVVNKNSAQEFRLSKYTFVRKPEPVGCAHAREIGGRTSELDTVQPKMVKTVFDDGGNRQRNDPPTVETLANKYPTAADLSVWSMSFTRTAPHIMPDRWFKPTDYTAQMGVSTSCQSLLMGDEGLLNYAGVGKEFGGDTT